MSAVENYVPLPWDDERDKARRAPVMLGVLWEEADPVLRSLIAIKEIIAHAGLHSADVKTIARFLHDRASNEDQP